MAKMKITNGFVNVNGEGNMLTGVLLEGTIKVGDKVVIDNQTRIPIIEIISSRKFHR